MRSDIKRLSYDSKWGSWRGGLEWSLRRTRSQAGARASGTDGRGVTRQRRALRRCHSDGYTAGGNAAPTLPRWRRVGTGSCEIRSDIWCVWAGTHGGIMAPNWCKSYNDIGAPIVLLSRAGLEMSGWYHYSSCWSHPAQSQWGTVASASAHYWCVRPLGYGGSFPESSEMKAPGSGNSKLGHTSRCTFAQLDS